MSKTPAVYETVLDVQPLEIVTVSGPADTVSGELASKDEFTVTITDDTFGTVSDGRTDRQPEETAPKPDLETELPAEHEDADCVVIVTPSMPTAGLAVYESIRRDATIPVVTCVDEPTEAVAESVATDRWLEWFRVPEARTRIPESATTLLATRITRLVERYRCRTYNKRLVASFDDIDRGVAITDPTGTVQVATPAYARQFGVDLESVLGRHWHDQYEHETVRHLESTAIPAATDGWRWKGTCQGTTVSDDPVSVTTTITAHEDGALVFVVDTDETVAGTYSSGE
ncbi:PAS domain-containing protein [Halobacteria archaeon AArc-curdl1]|uniref:PAS domain-containing protein n=1 Tax=Natronosalvus hydrolyticus TaxID=2979988 RepID=A0AAP2ZAU0_9EURY|nr:PAS domain-containing protein [Halobacteria archaeon AArc-curdl1]